MLICSSAFGQGNFNLEWQSPSGMSYWGICDYEKNNNVLEIALFDASSNSIKIYDGNTHILKYTIPYNWSTDSMSLDFPSGWENINKIDFNNDGIYDYVKAKRIYNGSYSPLILLRIYNSANNSLIKKMTFPFISGSRYYDFSDIDGDGYVELLITEYISNINTFYVYSTPAMNVAVNGNNISVPSYELKQNYPNPFNPSITIEYSINKTADVQIKIYDITGREIKSLAKGIQTSGTYKVNMTSKKLSSGTYFYQIMVDGNSDAKKMIVIK